MFGYPTGLGGLLIRKDKFKKLTKPWFAGGTVTLASAMTENFLLAPDHAKFEDGTINYLDIPALRYGFDLLTEIGMDRISLRVSLLTSFLLSQMRKLTHANGAPLVRCFGPQDDRERGGTIIFNFLEPDGEPQAYLDVESAANDHNISLRTGCFCNPGIDELNNHLQAGQLDSYFKSHKDDDPSVEDMMAKLHTMRGAIRISVGMISNLSDIHRFLTFMRSFAR
jgi:selenocysteine lyase/cysteine desulfurase